MATGTPLMQADSKFHAGSHVASTTELLVGIFGGAALLIFGLVLILSTRNCGVSIDPGGLYATNLFGKRSFEAKWADITALVKLQPTKTSGYRLTANGKSLALQTGLMNLNELIDRIRERSPNLQ